VRSYSGRVRANPVFLWGSPRVIPELLQFRPEVVFTSGFNIWALYVLLLKFVRNWRVILLWDGISPNVSRVNSRWRTLIRRLMARGYDLCLTNTQEALEFLRDFLRVPALRVACRPYEVPDLDLLTRAGSTLMPVAYRERPVFLFAGVLVERKGLDLLLRAAHALKRRNIREFSLNIVGSGPRSLELQKLAASLELEQQVIWRGYVPYHKMGAYYRECDVFVFPTREDIWGMVALEAMAFGKPIICSRYAGAREIVREGENGYIVEPRDIEELADRMERFIREPHLIARFGAASRVIMAPHTSQAAAAMLAHTIRSVLKGETDGAVPSCLSAPA